MSEPGRLRRHLLDLTPLRASPQFRLLWLSSIVSAIGSRLTVVAVPILVYRLTESTLAVGLVGLCTFVPFITASLWGGAIADVVDRRKLLLATEVGGALGAALLAWNASLDDPHLWAMYVLDVAVVSLTALATPAQRSAIPQLVGEELVTSAAALKAASMSGTFLIGPAISGVVIGQWGFTAAFLVDAATYLLAAAFVLAMKPIAQATEASKVGLAMIREGLGHLRGQPVLLGAFASDLNAMIFGMPTALFPAVLAQRFGDQESSIGLLYAMPFAGGLVATAFSGWTRRVRHHGRVVVHCIVVWGVAIVAFGLVDGKVATLTFLAVAGAADMVSAVSRTTILQLASPRHMLGRVEGVGMAVWASGPALGDFEAGAVADVTSVDFSIVSGGVLCVVGIGVLAAVLPGFYSFDSERDAATDEPEPPTGARTAPDI